jgi:hypothetical protein
MANAGVKMEGESHPPPARQWPSESIHFSTPERESIVQGFGAGRGSAVVRVRLVEAAILRDYWARGRSCGLTSFSIPIFPTLIFGEAPRGLSPSSPSFLLCLPEPINHPLGRTDELKINDPSSMID